MPVINGVYTKDFPALGRAPIDTDIIPIAEVANQITYKTTLGEIFNAKVFGTTGRLSKFTGANTLGNSILNEIGNAIHLTNAGSSYASFGIINPGTPGEPGIDNDAYIGSTINNDFTIRVNNTEAARFDTALRFKIANIQNADTDTDKFLVSDGGVVKYRTGTELRSDIGAGVGSVTSVGLTMPVAFSVANSPITSAGTLAVSAVGTASQYIRGDGQLATLPTGAGGGSAVNYYLNGSIASGVAGYQQMDNTAIIGTGTDFTLVGNGLIAQFLTDAGNPNRLLIPGGAWNLEMFFQVSSSGGNAKFYVDLFKYDGTTFTSIASGVTNPEEITGGTSIDLYLTSLAVPETALLITDRLAIRVYIVDNSGGRTVTLHTEDNTLCQVTTTFAGGISALNGLTANTQYFAVGTSGTDFNISSLSDTHTFNLPTASATNRGALSASDWSTFNNKQNAGSYVTLDTTQTITGTKTFQATTTFNTVGAKAIIAVSDTNIGVDAVSSTSIAVKATSGSGKAIVAESTSDIAAQLTSNTGLALSVTSLSNDIAKFFGASFALKASISQAGNITGNSFIKSGGTSSQFLKADGSVDSNSYALTSDLSGYVTLATAQTITGAKTFSVDTIVNGVNIGRGGGAISSNTRIGSSALNANTTGTGNTATGINALNANTTGNNNTSNGNNSLVNNTTGSQNSAYGYLSLSSNTTSSANTANGVSSLTNTTGNNNTAFGASAGSANTTGVNNIFFGYNSQGESPTESNRTWIGNTDTTSTWLGGNLLLGSRTNSTSDKLQVTGSVNVTGQLKLGSTITNGTYTYTLPSANGTLALTSDITSAISGTTNYIPKFTGANTIGNSIIQDDGTNTSIGYTSNPSAYRLDVNGTGRFSGAIIATGSSAGFIINRRDNSAYAGGLYSPSGSILLDMAGVGTALSFAASTGAATFSSSVTASSLNVQGSGYFPSKIITLTGAEPTRYSANIGTLIVDGSKIGLALGTRSDNVNYDNSLIIVNGNVGIGTTSPGALLHLGISPTANNKAEIFRASDGDLADFKILLDRKTALVDGISVLNTAAGVMSFETSNTERMRITSGGNVQPGTDNAYSLGVSGTRWSAVWAANGTIQTSDEREKKDIVNSDLGLDFISKLRPVSFKWKVGINKVTNEILIDEDSNPILDEEGNETNETVITPIEGKRTHYGLIAQEVKDALGDVDFGGFIHDSETDIMGLRYDQFVPLLIKSIQELNEKIIQLENK